MKEQQGTTGQSVPGRKISGTCEALLDFIDLLRVQCKNDHLQGFDAKWDKVRLSWTRVPDEDVLEYCTNCTKKQRSSITLRN